MIKVRISFEGFRIVNYYLDLFVAYSNTLNFLDCFKDYIILYIEIINTDFDLNEMKVVYSKYGTLKDIRKELNYIYESLLNREELQ